MSKIALLFLLVFFGGIVTALTYTPFAAFIVYEIVYFLNPDIRWWASGIPPIPYSFIIVLLMMGLLAKNFKHLAETSPWTEQTPLIWMVLLIAWYYVVSNFAIQPTLHDKYTTVFTKLVIIMLISYKLINSETALKACIWAYLVGCTYIGYVAWTIGRNSSGRVEGIGPVDAPDSNFTAALLVPAAVLLMNIAWQGNLKTKLVAGFLGAFIANGLVLINSRGSFLGVIGSLALFIMFMIFSRYQKKGQRTAAVGMIILGLCGAFYVTDDLFWERMATIQSEDENVSGASRITFWVTTFDMLEDRPWGLGVYGYNMLAPIYMDDETRGGVEFRSVHSMWFQGLSEVGWLGFAIYAFMFLSLFLATRKAKKFVVKRKEFEAYFQILALECAIVGFFIAGTFINRFRAEILFWMILFTAVAVKVYYYQKIREEKEEEEPKKMLEEGSSDPSQT